MKKRKYLLIFGAVLTTLLMISSATAVNFTDGGNSEEETEEEQQEPVMGNSPPVIWTFIRLCSWQVLATRVGFNVWIHGRDVDDDKLQYHIDWGDGDHSYSNWLNQPQGWEFAHKYQRFGRYRIKGWIEDEHGAVSLKKSITVRIWPGIKEATVNILSEFGQESLLNFGNGNLQTTQKQDPAEGTFGEEPATPPGGDDEEEEEQPDSEYYIDPNIELTSTLHLSKLERLVNKLDDEGYVTLVEELINELKKDGKVDAQDIKNIKDKYEFLAGSSFYAGKIIGNAGDYARAVGAPCRRHVLSSLFSGTIWASWPGPGLFVRWDCSYETLGRNSMYREYIDFTVGVTGNRIEDYHTGLALLQIGYWEMTAGWLDGGIESHIDLMVWSPLIVISQD